MLTIRDLKSPPHPPERWIYPRIDGSLIGSRNYRLFRKEIREHYESNGRPAPTEEEITQYLCDNVSIACFDGQQPYRNRYTDPPTFAQRGMPSPDWGVLNVMKTMAREGDRGLGDIIERNIGPIGGNLFKAWFLKTFGKSCGCKERQEEWNYSYPL